VITLASPLLLLVLIETGLRVFHAGPDLSLFTTEIVNGRAYHVMNPGVKYRYFPGGDFSPSTSVDYFIVPKPPGTYRIFCLGGSTTVGYPYWYNGSFSAFLRDRLRRLFPDRSIEVINVGMTATNSYTVVDMARDVVHYEPDLIIVYDGHNEFYGALGIASNQSPGKSWWISRTYLRLLRVRTFVELREAYNWIAGLFRRQPEGISRGTMMEKVSLGNYVPYGSADYLSALSTFENNLDELRTLCAKNRVPVILSTQVSNLRDQPPFIVLPGKGESPQERAAFTAAFNRGLARFKEGEPASALAEFRSALQTDSMRADTHFQIARCLDALGDRGAAGGEYIKARDYDQLRFRTSSDFNSAILRMNDTSGMFVVDMERVFQERSADSLIGNTLITEHLHPNSGGYFLMGRAYAVVMRARGLLAPAGEWARRDTVSDGELWGERNLSTLDELLARRRTEILTSGWPFRAQVPTVEAVPGSDTLRQIVERVTRGVWDWKKAHEEAAAHYERCREPDSLAREERVIVSQIPLDVNAYLNLAHVYLIEGKLGEMAAVLTASQRVQPTILAARALGDVALQTGKPRDAIAQYESMDVFPQSRAEQVENGYLLALAYERAGMPDRATAQLLKILKLKPDYKPAVDMLARIHG
jgi:tetratricopeptide (TPR) repeat protein